MRLGIGEALGIMGIRSFIVPAALIAAALAASPASAGLLESKCHPLGLLGGYRQHDLGDRMVEISVLGNGAAGGDFPKACTLERARAIAAAQGYARFAVVKYKGTITYRRATGGYVGGSAKTVIKLLGPGEAAAPLKGGEVVYFDVASMQPERPADLPAYPAAVADAAPARAAAPGQAPQPGPVDVLGLLADPQHFR